METLLGLMARSAVRIAIMAVAAVGLASVLLPSATDGACTPTVSITIKFTGYKSAGDSLGFEAFPGQDCSESLGQQNCAYVWVWNVEVKGVVSDSASQWIITQVVLTSRRKGQYLDSSTGQLVSFNTSTGREADGPDATQQYSGQPVAYYLDTPGSPKNYLAGGSATPIENMTQVYDFQTTFCSKVDPGDCSSVNWYDKLVISDGLVNTAESVATYGSASTNF